MRKTLDLETVPLLMGELGSYLKDYHNEKISQLYPYVNEALKNIVQKMPCTGLVSAEGLKANPDNLHFSAVALREYGLRYYEVFKKLENRDKVFVEKPDADAAIKNELEYL